MCISMNVKSDKGLRLERNVECKEKKSKKPQKLVFL